MLVNKPWARYSRTGRLVSSEWTVGHDMVLARHPADEDDDGSEKCVSIGAERHNYQQKLAVKVFATNGDVKQIAG